MKPSLIYGCHPIEALLKQHPEQITTLIILDHTPNPRLQKIVDLAKEKKIKINFLPKNKFLNLIEESVTHQGVLAMIQEKTQWQEHHLIELFNIIMKI